ncbi:unnamed protein product [Soboliphyme baturini]|uniref:LIM zinc-binding domain-containing protein n=1 Tax=Soboliphyme baturini TaxID=241478 RepID=A0A183JBA0_9BILA|nr:unnamed protein product [Soboliphyme baturini]
MSPPRSLRRRVPTFLPPTDGPIDRHFDRSPCYVLPIGRLLIYGGRAEGLAPSHVTFSLSFLVRTRDTVRLAHGWSLSGGTTTKNHDMKKAVTTKATLSLFTSQYVPNAACVLHTNPQLVAKYNDHSDDRLFLPSTTAAAAADAAFDTCVRCVRLTAEALTTASRLSAQAAETIELLTARPCARPPARPSVRHLPTDRPCAVVALISSFLLPLLIVVSPIGERLRRAHIHRDNRLFNGEVMLTMVRCAGCDQPIYDRYLSHVMDKTWHASCLICWVCKSPLNDKCYTRDGNIYCKSDFYK